MGYIGQTWFVGVDVRQMSPLPFMDFLLRLPNILFFTLIASKTVYDVCSFAGDVIPDHESFVGGSNGYCVAKRSFFAGIAPFIAAFVEACCCGCGFLLEMTEFVMNHFAFPVFEKAATLLALVAVVVDAGWWWLWVDYCVGRQSPADQEVIQVSTSTVRHNWRFWKKCFAFFT